MRNKIMGVFALSACFLTVLSSDHAKADGFLAGATVGLVGGAIIGASASPYYYGPYGYAPAYYHAVPSYSPPVYAYNYGYGYDYNGPSYSYSQPYYVTSACWGRRLPVYDRYGGVVAVRSENSCR